jgi:hypothetical protein
MIALILSSRHADSGCCDMCGRRIAHPRRGSRLLLIMSNGDRLYVRGCRPCWRYLARAASR